MERVNTTLSASPSENDDAHYQMSNKPSNPPIEGFCWFSQKKFGLLCNDVFRDQLPDQFAQHRALGLAASDVQP